VDVLHHDGEYNITSQHLTQFAKSDDVPDICEEKTLIRSHSSKEVFVLLGGFLRWIPNARRFYDLGYSFDDIQTVPDWVFGKLRRGYPL
jgi:hypothetical protein